MTTPDPTVKERLAANNGRWTPMYPALGTGPVSYDDCISPEFFADEREAIFKRWWLYVGRAEQVQRPGAYFTRELPGLASLVIVRDLDGTIRAHHNVCAHRGNKVVWQEHPQDESAGTCRQFACKYHGWQYGLDGMVNHVTNEEQFFDLDRSSLRLPTVHCDEVAGFVFVNLGDDPEPLRDFLGEQVCAIESWPFERMTHRSSYSTVVHGNWKLAANTIQEWYHPPYVHQKFIHPDVRVAETMTPPIDSYHYDLFGRHFINSVPGPRLMPQREPGQAGTPRRDMVWVYKLFRGGLFGPDDVPDLGPEADCLNPGGIASWGNDQYWVLPNLSIQMWSRNWYITYAYWPESVDSHRYDIDIYYVPPTTARERLAQELTNHMVIEFAMQDVNTIEATHASLARRAQTTFHLSDQELMIRSFHHSIGTAVAAHRAEHEHSTTRPSPARHVDRGRRVPISMGPVDAQATEPGVALLPAGFEELQPWVADWAKATRAERYEVRLTKPFEETCAFYDAIAARAEDAMVHLDGCSFDELDAPSERLLWLLYSMIVVADAVTIFKQPTIPDSGSAFYDQVIEPRP